MNTITLKKNNSIILLGFALSAFFAATLPALTATADPVLNLSNSAAAEFNQLAIDQSRAGAFELDYLKPNFIAALKNKSNKTEINTPAINRPKTGATEQDSFLPTFTMAIEKRFNKLEFTSLDRFFISLTEQDRSEHLPARNQFSMSADYAGHDQPELSRSNLLNSPFANLVVKKLTGQFSQ